MNRIIAFLVGGVLVALYSAAFLLLAQAGLAAAGHAGTIFPPRRYYEIDSLVGLATYLYAFILGGMSLQNLRHFFESVRRTAWNVTKLALLLYVPLAGGYGAMLLARHGVIDQRPAFMFIIGVPITFLAEFIFLSIFDGGGMIKTIRGRELTTFKRVVAKARAMLRKEPAEVWWGGVELPASAAETNFCVVGAIGSGKTVTLHHLMRSVLPLIQPGSEIRAVLYDAKRDLRSVLDGMGIPAGRVKMLNPFDARSVAWDMAKDIQSPATAEQIASILIPAEQGPNRFFSDAARHLLRGVLIAYILTDKGRWTFRDVILAMESEKSLKELLSRHEVTRPLVEQYFGEKKTFQNIQATIATYMSGYATVAALWSHATERVSLTDWLSPGNEAILVLGNDDSLRAPIDAINRVLFQRLTELLLAQPALKKRRTWLVLDELKEAGPLDGLPRILTKGRSNGVRVVIGFQDIDGLEQVYGYHLPHEIVGQCANKAILRLDSHRTARWAAETIGKAEVKQYTVSISYSMQGSSETVSEQITNREAVIAEELMTLPLPDKTGFSGYYIMPALGVYSTRLKFPPRYAEQGKELDFVPRPTEQQFLRPFGPDDDVRFAGLDPNDEPPTKPTGDSKPTDIDDMRRITRERR